MFYAVLLQRDARSRRVAAGSQSETTAVRQFAVRDQLFQRRRQRHRVHAPGATGQARLVTRDGT